MMPILYNDPAYGLGGRWSAESGAGQFWFPHQAIDTDDDILWTAHERLIIENLGRTGLVASVELVKTDDVTAIICASDLPALEMISEADSRDAFAIISIQPKTPKQLSGWEDPRARYIYTTKESSITPPDGESRVDERAYDTIYKCVTLIMNTYPLPSLTQK